MTIDMAQFHQVFFEESFEGIDVMESGLLNMSPGSADSEEINAIFRAAHSIKGGSGTFGFTAISDFTHTMETLLDEMRDGRRPVSAETVDALLRAVDLLREMLTAAKEGGELDRARIEGHQAELKQLLDGGKPLPTITSEPPPPAEKKHKGWHILFHPYAHMMRTGNDPLLILRELASLGELKAVVETAHLPSLAEMEPETCYLSWDLRLKGEIGRKRIDEIFDWVEEDCDLAITPLAREETASAPAAPDAKEEAPTAPELKPVPPPVDRRKGERRQSAASASNSIRVDIHKIDSLINMVGELVITQSMLGMLGEDFEMSRMDRLREGLEQLERHTRKLQESVMQIRMLPIRFTFSRFPRLVHDLSTKMGKKIELKMSGEQTEVDKTVIEKIGDPLVHLVRNSLDHGIETPEARVAAGKPETGTVELKAFHRGGNIVIEVRDDGRGLDRERLLNKALEREIISSDAELTDQQIYELIFVAGFSTAEEVSDVSGRGVGMDVVRKNINQLGGRIDIESEPGRGSAFTIRLPLTLAILDGQSVAVGEEVYIVPLASIVESLQIRPGMINRVAGRGETFKLRNRYLPVVRLHEAFGAKSAKAGEMTEGLLVVVEGEGHCCGLFVDDLLGQQQVVIKSLEANYRKVEGISGATILGDGSVALILDIRGLLRLAGREQTRHPLRVNEPVI